MEVPMPARVPALALSAALTLLAVGCATPLPDGSRIQRLPETSPAAPVTTPPPAPAPLSAEESRALTELNARILREQDEARRREDALAVQRDRDAQIYWGLGLGFGWPHGGHRGRHGGWVWGGGHWFWRPYWGVEFWTPLPR
jgi:hypothetical protein